MHGYQCLSVCQSTFLVQTEISHPLLDGLPWSVVNCIMLLYACLHAVLYTIYAEIMAASAVLCV